MCVILLIFALVKKVGISEIFILYLNVFEWDDSSGFLVCSVLEIVETIVVKDEPASLPRFVPSTLFPQPAFAVRIEERVHQIVAIVLGDLERFSLDAVVQTLENIARQVLAIVDATIHRYKLFQSRFLLDARIVKARVENDDGEREDITGIWKDKNKKNPQATCCGMCD